MTYVAHILSINRLLDQKNVIKFDPIAIPNVYS